MRRERHSVAEMIRVFGRIGVLSFGGPAAQIALMHRELVDPRHWMTERQFLGALSFTMLLPGPEAMQLATYVGWRLDGTRGGLIAGGLFVAPGALVVLMQAALYRVVGQLPFGAALFRVGRRALKGPMAHGLAGWALHVEWISAQPRLNGALPGITAAVVGVILNLSLWFALHVFFAEVSRIEFCPATIWWPEIAGIDPGAIGLAGGRDGCLCYANGIFWRVLALLPWRAWFGALDFCPFSVDTTSRKGKRRAQPEIRAPGAVCPARAPLCRSLTWRSRPQSRSA